MAALWRYCRHCRLRAPSSITNRNRNLLYVIVFFPLLLTLLLIPGGEIANNKYVGDTNKDFFLTTFDEGGRDAGDDVIRGPRSLEKKSVLLWTSKFGRRSWDLQDDPFRLCPQPSCDITLDRAQEGEVDALLFHAADLSEAMTLPEHSSGQVWILHNQEPPYNIRIDLRRYNNLFNWTSWYREDADIFSPYGDYVEKISDENYAINEDDENDDNDNDVDDVSDDRNDVPATEPEDLETKRNATSSDDTTEDYYRLHDRVLFFAASNCRDRSRRYKKVSRLKQYLPIDEFGDCGTLQCSKGDEQCELVFARYQFVLAFENGYCREYVTEKLWNAYRRMQIPIVSGGADYQQIAIPGSYIDYDNFSSVEELATYIHLVSTTPDLYNSYFKWRKIYEVIQLPSVNWCQICEALNDKGRRPQVYKDLAGWVAQDSCPLYSPYQDFWTQVYLGLFKLFGI